MSVHHFPGKHPGWAYFVSFARHSAVADVASSSGITSALASAATIAMVLVAAPARAALDVSSFSYQAGTDAGGVLPITVPHQAESRLKTGYAVQVLHFDFNTAVAAPVTFALPLNVSAGGTNGTGLRLRLRAPMTNPIQISVFDAAGLRTDHQLNRETAVMDDLGWSTVKLDVSMSGVSRALTRIEIGVSPPPAGAGPTGLAGTLYLRNIEVLNQSAGTNAAPCCPSGVVDVQSPSPASSTETLPLVGAGGAASGQSAEPMQRIDFDFAGQHYDYVATVMAIQEQAASYAHFRAKLPAGVGLRLQATDHADVQHNYDIDRSQERQDTEGWATYTVRLDRPNQNGVPTSDLPQGGIKALAIQVRRLPDGLATGSAYFGEIDLLLQAPTPAAPLERRRTPVTARPLNYWNLSDAQHTPQISQFVPPESTAADPIYGVNYDFTWATRIEPLGTLIEQPFQVSPSVDANRFSFQAKVPPGVSLRFRFRDANGARFQADVVKPLATVDDAGWVQYNLNLQADTTGATVAQPINEVSIFIRRNTNIAVTSPGIAPTGSVLIRRVWVGHEGDQLDLSSLTPASATVKPAGSAPLPALLGVVAHKPVEDAQHLAQLAALGFQYVRMDMTWETLAPKTGQAGEGPNQYNWAAKDPSVDAIFGQRLTPVLILGYNSPFFTPQLLTNPITWDTKLGISTADNGASYLQYVRDVVVHYAARAGGKRLIFEIWNEPNSNGFWKLANPGDDAAQQYAVLLQYAAQAVKESCAALQPKADCVVISGGLARIDFPFLAKIGGALQNVDAIALHPYTLRPYPVPPGDASPNVEPETQADEILAARAWLAFLKIGKPLVTSELGYSSAVDRDGYLTDGTTDAARLRQAQRDLRDLLTSIAVDNQMHVFYRIKDWYMGDPTFSATEKEHNFGLFQQDDLSTPGVPRDKPAKEALATFIQAVADLRYQGLVSGTPSPLQAMKFTPTPGDPARRDTVYVAWVNGPLQQGDLTVRPDCAANASGDPARWDACITDMLGHRPTSCRAVMQSGPSGTVISVNGRVACTVTEQAGPLIVRTHGN